MSRFLRGENIAARTARPLERLARWCRRKPLLASLSAAIVLLAASLLIGSTAATLLLSQERQKTLDHLQDAVVARDDMAIHLSGIDGFVPEHSYASVIITVPDPDALYHSFAEGLRAAMGRLPMAGIPRMVRPRKRWGTVYGFSVVDVGGNWLRISKSGATEDAADELPPGLPKVRLVS